MFKLFVFTCPECQEEFEELTETMGETPPCPACGSPSKAKWVAPAIRTSDSRTYLDGTRPGWAAIKEGLDLDVAMADMAPLERKQAEREKAKIDKVHSE